MKPALRCCPSQVIGPPLALGATSLQQQQDLISAVQLQRSDAVRVLLVEYCNEAAPGHGISALPSSIIDEGVQQHGLVLCIGHAGGGALLAEHGAALINVGKVGCMTTCTALHTFG